MLKQLIKLAYNYWPSLYKKRYYKTLDSLSTGNYKCEPELLYIQQILKSDSVFIDIGTNKGIYLYQAEKVITNGKIIGFEPNKSLVNYIKPLFPKAEIYPLAASSHSGTAVLNIPKKGNGLQDTRASLEAMGDDVERVEIQMVALDEFAKEKNLSKIDVIKIDVEGHEFDTIKGCAEILKTIKPIFIIEIELRHAHYSIKDIFDFIIGFGYEVFYFDRKSLKTVPFDFNQMVDFQKDEYLNDFNRYINNFIFIPKN